MSGERGPLGSLPQDPSHEELARHWTLKPEELRAVRGCRGEGSRLYFAMQIVVLRNCGRFVTEAETVPIRLLQDLVRQLRMRPCLSWQPPAREATRSEQRRRAREVSGFSLYDSSAETRLEEELREEADRGARPEVLRRRAEELLFQWRIVRPGPSLLSRLVARVAEDARSGVFVEVSARVPRDVALGLEGLLEVPEGSRKSALAELLESSKSASADSLVTVLERERTLARLGVDRIDWEGVEPELRRRLAESARALRAQDFQRMRAPRRRALLAALAAELRQSLLDESVALHDRFVQRLLNRANKHHEERMRLVRREKSRADRLIGHILEIVGDPECTPSEVIEELFERVGRPALTAARDSWREIHLQEKRGYLEALVRGHSHAARYLPLFLALPFEGDPALLEALELARSRPRLLPRHAPVDFVPRKWRSLIRRPDGRPDLRLWELFLALAMRNALRSGDLYLPRSRRHVSFSNLVYPDELWVEERAESYSRMELPTSFEPVLARLTEEWQTQADNFAATLGTPDAFASIENGRLKCRREDALEIPPSVRELRRVLMAHLDPVGLDTLLEEVEQRTGFTDQMQPPLGLKVHRPSRGLLLAGLVAQGTNLGVSRLSSSTDDITAERLARVVQTFLRQDSLKAANTALVNFHYSLPLSAVWGDGTLSSSDGQRFGLAGRSPLGNFYPRYFGYYDRVLTVLTHQSDQGSVYGTQAISCGPREATYVLDGLLQNDTLLQPREHATDTAGYTEQLFGLCYLLGISFMPRIKDLKDQQLHRLPGCRVPEKLAPLFRGRRINVNLLAEQWDSLVRLAFSLLNRTAPAHVVLRRLASSGGSLASALTMLGQVVKTIYLLRYLSDPRLRRRVQLQLNRGESRHALARCLFFGNQGEFRTHDYTEVMNKATCLSLLSNAVLVYNTLRLGDLVADLRRGGHPVPPADLARISPLLYEHVLPHGRYTFRLD